MIRFGTIGTSWITESFIKASKEVDGLKHTSVYSRSFQKAAAFAQKQDAPHFFTSLEEMAKSEQIDAVYIASPNGLHYEQSLFFLQHKKHVICEKPIACSKEEAQQLFKVARENGVVFMEAMMSMHVPQLDILKESLSRIGRISLARIDFSQLSSKYPALQNGELPNIFNIEFKTGCIMDIGIYCIYLILYLFPEYINVTATAVKLPSTIDLCGASIFEYDDKVVSATYSKIANGATLSEIQGDKGTLMIDMVSNISGIKLRHNDGTMEEIFSVENSVLPMKYEAQRFCDYITDFSSHKQLYQEMSDLSVKVSETLSIIRNKSGILF